MKVALLSSFSIEFLHDSLVAMGLLGGMRIEIYQAGLPLFDRSFSTPAAGSILGSGRGHRRGRRRGLDPGRIHGFMQSGASGGIATSVEQFRTELDGLIRAFGPQLRAAFGP